MFYYYKGAFSWHRENQNLTSQAALPLVAACIYNADWVLQPGVRGLGPWSHIGKTTRSKQRPVNDLVALCLSRSLWIFPRCSLVLFVQDAPFDQAGEEPMGADPHCAALLRSAHSPVSWENQLRSFKEKMVWFILLWPMDYMQLFQNYIYIFIYFLWKQMELKKNHKRQPIEQFWSKKSVTH